MYRNIIFLSLLLLLFSCSGEEPVQFSEQALKDMVLTENGDKITFREVLHKNKGKTMLIDVWASWCKDCIVGFPKLKELQKEYPEVTYVFLSVDRGTKAWKKGIEKYNLKGQHYNFPKGQKNGDFVEFINLWWIPRYMVIDKKGNISVFKATDAGDSSIKKALTST